MSGDIRDYKKLKASIFKSKPDFIIHMAAQALVRNSYINSKYTYEVNTLGTLNILNIILMMDLMIKYIQKIGI